MYSGAFGLRKYILDAPISCVSECDQTEAAMTLEGLGKYGVPYAGEIVGSMLLPDNHMAAWDDKDILQAQRTALEALEQMGNHASEQAQQTTVGYTLVL